MAAALRLWRGEALAGVPGPFAEGQRLRLAELRLATAERHIELLTANGRHAEAAELLRELVAAHPHREDLRAKLATLTPGAVLLTSPPIGSSDVRPVGVPFADGRAASEAPTGAGIRSGGVPAPGSRLPAGTSGLFGRDAILRRIRRAVTDVAAGRGGSILLEGPAGIGKTALLAAALRTVPDGCRIGWATGDEVTRNGLLDTLRDGVESALVASPTHSTTGALVSASFPADRVEADQPDRASTDGPDRGDAEAAGQAVELVRRAAAEAPLILVIDDSHWADPTTLRAWAMLSQQTSEVPLLLVAAARSGARAVTEQPAGEIVTLAPLDPASAGALVRAVAPQPPDAAELSRVLDEAGGHPYYLRQLAMHGSEPFPAAGLVATVNAHLAPHPEATRQVLRAIAFLSEYEVRAPGTQPPGCTIAELAAATDQHLEDLEPLLAPVRAAGILAPGERVRFRNRIVVRTLCESTPAALRVALCRRYAERLAEAGTAPERVVALVLAGEVPVDDCAGSWLIEHVERISEAAPRIAIAVLAQAHAQRALDLARRRTLTAWLARLLLSENRNAAAEAGWVAARTRRPGTGG